MSDKDLNKFCSAFVSRSQDYIPQTLRSMSDKELRNLVQTYACELPEALTVATLCALKYISSLEPYPMFRDLGIFDGKRTYLYPSSLPTYTLCADTVRETAVQGDEERLKKNQESSIIVGRINQGMADYWDQDTWKQNSNVSIEVIRGLQYAVGVAAQWKFTDSSSSSHEAVTKQQQVITSHSQPSNASAAANEIISSSSVSSEERSSDYKL